MDTAGNTDTSVYFIYLFYSIKTMVAETDLKILQKIVNTVVQVGDLCSLWSILTDVLQISAYTYTAAAPCCPDSPQYASRRGISQIFLSAA